MSPLLMVSHGLWFGTNAFFLLTKSVSSALSNSELGSCRYISYSREFRVNPSFSHYKNWILQDIASIISTLNGLCDGRYEWSNTWIGLIAFGVKNDSILSSRGNSEEQCFWRLESPPSGVPLRNDSPSPIRLKFIIKIYIDIEDWPAQKL